MSSVSKVPPQRPDTLQPLERNHLLLPGFTPQNLFVQLCTTFVLHRTLTPPPFHPCQLRKFSRSDTILRDMGIIQSVLPALPFVQIFLSILLVGAILLQQRGSSLGGAFGGDNFQAAFHQRRGAELFLFRLSIGLAILFAVSAFLNVLA